MASGGTLTLRVRLTAPAPGAILACQFFGPDDEFVRAAAPGEMSSHAAPDVDRLLAGLQVLHREEVNRAGQVGKLMTDLRELQQLLEKRVNAVNGGMEAAAIAQFVTVFEMQASSKQKENKELLACQMT